MIQHILPESISNNTETFTQILPHNILSDIFEELLPNITTHIFHISCHTIHFQEVFFFKKKKLYGLFLWMGFNCLKARATSRRQFTFYL